MERGRDRDYDLKFKVWYKTLVIEPAHKMGHIETRSAACTTLSDCKKFYNLLKKESEYTVGEYHKIVLLNTIYYEGPEGRIEVEQ